MYKRRGVCMYKRRGVCMYVCIREGEYEGEYVCMYL